MQTARYSTKLLSLKRQGYTHKYIKMVFVGVSNIFEMFCWSIAVGISFLVLLLWVWVPLVAWVLRFWYDALYPQVGGSHYMGGQDGTGR